MAKPCLLGDAVEALGKGVEFASRASGLIWTPSRTSCQWLVPLRFTPRSSDQTDPAAGPATATVLASTRPIAATG
jgi:hypothetical protein